MCPLFITQLDAPEYKVSNHLHKEGPKLKLFKVFFKNNHSKESNAFSNQQVIKDLSYYFPQDSASNHIKGVCSHP